MTSSFTHSPLNRLVEQLRAGDISRRQFVQRAALLGVGVAASAMIVNTIAPVASAQESATPAATEHDTRPLAPEDQVRGEGGELMIIQWQAVTTLSAHNATGGKDYAYINAMFKIF